MNNTQLSPPADFQSSVQSTGTGISIIDNSCKNVINLPSIDSPAAPTMVGDLNNAKNVANQWSSSIRPQIMASLQGIVSFNGVFQGIFSEIFGISQQIASGDTTQIPQFRKDLGVLQNATQAQETQVNMVQNLLTDYLTKEVDTTINVLNNDSNQLKSALNSFSEQMNSLKQQMKETQEKIESESSNPFSYLWNLLTGQLKALQEQQMQLQYQLEQLNSQLQQSSDALNIIMGYQGSFGQIQGGINGMANGWEYLNGDLKETIADENITDFNVFTPALVQAASSDWTVVANLANSFK